MVETTDGVLMGTPLYMAPERILASGWTLTELSLMSWRLNSKVCELCDEKIRTHGFDGMNNLICPNKGV